eukprot:Gregarina_sp_Poly_1__10735@NODE_817_length_6176_cov_6_331478_g592_i0_p2_GENE_NODE_817_length_6176_cov_6_331478_g592_i0NODE_817_length_6176_cov_6_331478_g592_i0_p2_ORF_typecomplete_len315_score28_73_NODE_817_length_6176_cov_6_331478_g592_i050826026
MEHPEVPCYDRNLFLELNDLAHVERAFEFWLWSIALRWLTVELGCLQNDSIVAFVTDDQIDPKIEVSLHKISESVGFLPEAVYCFPRRLVEGWSSQLLITIGLELVKLHIRRDDTQLSVLNTAGSTFNSTLALPKPTATDSDASGTAFSVADLVGALRSNQLRLDPGIEVSCPKMEADGRFIYRGCRSKKYSSLIKFVNKKRRKSFLYYPSPVGGFSLEFYSDGRLRFAFIYFRLIEGVLKEIVGAPFLMGHVLTSPADTSDHELNVQSESLDWSCITLWQKPQKKRPAKMAKLSIAPHSLSNTAITSTARLDL